MLRFLPRNTRGKFKPVWIRMIAVTTGELKMMLSGCAQSVWTRSFEKTTSDELQY